MLAVFVVAFLAIVFYGVLASLVVEALDTSDLPAHDPVLESRGIAIVYMRGPIPRVTTQRRRHELFKRAASHGMPVDALRFLDASMNGARTWKDARGFVHAVTPATVYRSHCGPVSAAAQRIYLGYAFAFVVGLASVGCDQDTGLAYAIAHGVRTSGHTLAAQRIAQASLPCDPMCFVGAQEIVLGQ